MPFQHWDGIEDTETDVGTPGETTVRYIENASFLVDGELPPRPGFGAPIANSGIVAAELGAYAIFFKANGNIESSPQTGAGNAVLRTGYNVAVPPTPTQALQRLYVTNDFDPMLVTDDGVTMRSVGIVAPSAVPALAAAASGGVTVGTHLIRYRYQDQSRNRLSDPSPAASITIAAGNQTLNVTPTASPDGTVSNIIIEMTAAGASTYYRVATIANLSVLTAVVTDDATLIQGVSAARDGEFQHQPPPIAALVHEHRQRLFWWGATQRVIAVTFTNGSTTVAGTGFSQNWAGRQLVDASGTVYTILVSTSTQITLSALYAGASGPASATIRSGTPGLLGWSRATFPESFDPQTYARNVTIDAGDTPSAMASFLADLYLIGTRSMRRLVYTGDPAAGMLLSLPGTLGAFHQRCVCEAAPGIVFGWGRDGAWVIAALQPKKISQDIESTITSLADPAQTASRFVCYEPTQRIAMFFFQTAADTAAGITGCRAAAAYHLDKGYWQIMRFRQPMTAAAPNTAYLDRQRLMLCDANGYSWRVGVQTNDGGGNGVVSATAGTTTSITGANSAVAGQMAYRPKTSEERLVLTAGPALIIVATPFATPVAAGELVYVGSIRQRLLTDWFVAEDESSKIRPQVLLVGIRPNRLSTVGTIQVRFYQDFDDNNPVSITSFSGDTWPQGVSPAGDGISWTVDLDAGAQDGFVPVPITADWKRAIRAEVIAEYPGDGPRFTLIKFSADARAVVAQPVTRE